MKWWKLTILPLAIPHLVPACSCIASFSLCKEVAASNFVFVGTVESVVPGVLDRWNLSAHSRLQNKELVQLEKDQSPSGFAKLRAAYLDLFGDAPDEEKRALQDAQTSSQLHAVLTWISSQGTLTHFKVKTVFQHRDDDDDDAASSAKNDDDDKKGNQKAGSKHANKDDKAEDDDNDFQPTSLDVWTEGGDCGVDFQKGETYLVYANSDEETDRLQTTICNRTKRLSDAGEDLAYLYFLQNGGDASSRLEGFVTSDIAQLTQDQFRYSGKIASPVPDIVVELRSDGGTRYTEPDRNGRFVFDGLAPGNYELLGLEPNYPERTQIVSGPTPVRVEAHGKGCASATLLVLTHTGR